MLYTTNHFLDHAPELPWRHLWSSYTFFNTKIKYLDHQSHSGGTGGLGYTGCSRLASQLLLEGFPVLRVH